MSVRRLVLTALVLVGLSSPAFAQPKVEVSGFIGWSFNDGVSFDGIPVNGSVYTKADPADAVSYGFTFGVYVTPQAEIEFLWNRQPSSLEVTGSGPMLAADMNLDNYHAAFSGRTVDGMAKFSWAFGGGVKAFVSENIGFKGTFRWTPTYIKTEGEGWWCDPWWGCYPVGSVYYANQIEFSGGIVARFD